MNEQQRDRLNQYETDLIGKVVRLDIPLTSVMNLRRVAEELRGLAHQFDCMGRFRNDKPMLVMGEVKSLVHQTNRRLRKIKGRGRPRTEPVTIKVL